MAKMQRPAWTVCFGVIWLLLIIAAIIMHIAIGKVNPAIEDFPDNLVKGFMVVFGFNDLKALAHSVETHSETALAMCNSFVPSQCTSLDPSTYCQTSVGQQSVDTTAQKDGISSAFLNGLKKIEIVGTDKYLGTPDFASAAGNIGTIQTEMDKISGSAQCCVVTPVYCEIWKSAEILHNSYAQIKVEIDKLTTGEGIESFNNAAKNLKFLHVLPWILFLSTLFFAVMWWRNGACCCCSNGSLLHGCVFFLPQAIFWLLTFIIMSIFAGIGWAFGPVVMTTHVSDFKGNPTVGDLIDHIQTKFPEFWAIVFDELEEGLATFRTASTLFVIACLIIAVYSCAFCCCRPFGLGEAAKDGGQV